MAHFVAPAHCVVGIKLRLCWLHISSPPCMYCHQAIKCAALAGTVLRRQNVPCESTHFVIPHPMDLNIHSDIYLVNTKEAIHYILVVCIYYIH